MDQVDEVTRWIGDGKTYDDGVALYARIGRNPALKRIFPGRGDRYADKLEYELRKLAGLPEPVKQLAPSSLPAPDPHYRHLLDIESRLESETDTGATHLPEPVSSLAREFVEAYKRKALAHKELKAVGGDNNPEAVVRRQPLVEEIHRLALRLDELWPSYEHWRKEGDPVPDDPASREATSPEALQELKNKIDNLKKTLSKDRLFLEYQAVKKLAAPNPLPHGPRRTELENRIKAKEAEMDELKRRVHGAAQN